MTKAEELTLLERIEELIASAGVDSYIGMTFAGVTEICRRNIENDWGDSPVDDLEEERKLHNKKEAEMFVKIQELEQQVKNAREYHEYAEQIMSDMDEQITDLKDEINAKDAEIEKLGHMIDGKVAECERRSNECIDGIREVLTKKDVEIMRLKAEIYDLRKERVE